MATKEQDRITEQIELLVKLMKVESAVKENITEDYTLSKLDKDEKEFIAENYQNAEFAKAIIQRYCDKGYQYQYDEEKEDWIRNDDGTPKKVPMGETEKDKIMENAKRIFEFFMVHPHMIAILNRNQPNNYLVGLLGKQGEEEKKVEYGIDDRNLIQKIGDRLKGVPDEDDE